MRSKFANATPNLKIENILRGSRTFFKDRKYT